MGSRLEDILEVLSNPRAYPHEPQAVEVIQTHISVVFLAGDLVYKVKKPVDFGFLDFSTLEKRRYYCHEEVRLNSRFSDDVYLRVDEIFEGPGGINLNARGDVIDYAVVMRRLPHDGEMVRMLENEEVDEEILIKVADKIAEVHEDAESNERIQSFARPEVISKNLEENFTQVRPFVGRTIDLNSHREISTQAREFVTRESELFLRRIEQGRIKDCHGDLHTDHIVIEEEVILFDCIEFNERFRFQDTASDLAFLLMDLDFRGFPGFAKIILNRLMRREKDSGFDGLIDFYKSYRAFVRGKVESFTLDEPEISQEDRELARETARQYFDLAASYLRPIRPFLVIFCGLMGSGKSYLSERLAFRMGMERVSSDIVRKKIFQTPSQEHRLDKFGQGIYSSNAKQRVYRELLDRADRLLGEGSWVILDASFIDKTKRVQAFKLAQRHDAQFLIIHCVAPEDTIRERLEERVKRTDEPSDGRWELYHDQKEALQPIAEDEQEYCVEWDSSQAPGPFLVNLARELMVR
jgi:hypothetical protein